ncbi:hypothetical protein H8K47_03080 [Undibacterium sp. CY7W]|uniref:Class IIb bacteriocin, lactobin A/cerein 7B family n=1 Tax=Undibacterium rugosum TaxID=2762291 RepID=A0A923KYH4_9BURK|nr:hypothetical protein [Undibacterium rugosum]MBC3934338.1 hypothetical protein [Undibacterium rugosum]
MMTELNTFEVEYVSGGVAWVGAILTAIAIVDAVRDAYNGFSDGLNGK